MLGIFFSPFESLENLNALEEPKSNGLAKSVINFTDSEMHLPAIKLFFFLLKISF